jgi:hypothetical protein
MRRGNFLTGVILPVEELEYFGFVLQMMQPKGKSKLHNNNRLFSYQSDAISLPTTRGGAARYAANVSCPAAGAKSVRPGASPPPQAQWKIPGGAGGAAGQLMDRAGIHCQSFSRRAVDPNRFEPLITGDFCLVTPADIDPLGQD